MAANLARQGAKTAQAQAPVPDPRQDTWDEQKIEAALHRLKELHIKVGSCFKRYFEVCISNFFSAEESQKHGSTYDAALGGPVIC